jgi:lipopolysaccharide/colanic/teichoic acid biosynthesis glycosyltransferase
MVRTYEIAKRVFDLVAAVAALVLFGWLLVLIYVLVRLTSAGGGLFVQDRAGREGRVFRLIKFRTMRAGHVHDPDPAIVIAGDHASLTPLGRCLRKYKLDELPQLLNVLTGQMSLVGPRPTVPEQVAEYDDFKRQRLVVTPGITGLAQVNGGTALTWDERIEWDVYYVHNRSFLMDLRILLRTVVVTLAGTEKHVRRFREIHPGWEPPSG